MIHTDHDGISVPPADDVTEPPLAEGSMPLPESERTQRILRTIWAFDHWLVRAYCVARFRIIHQRFLDELLQFMPQKGDVLELGCGFGLFALYFAQSHPGLSITGIDLNVGRIALARKAAETLHVHNVRFNDGDARQLSLHQQYDAIYMLDILHHIPPEDVGPLITTLKNHLKPNGILLIKDVDTRPRRKMYFTLALDVLMTRGEMPHYWPSAELITLLNGCGFQVFSYDMVDLLPYSHRLYFCVQQGLHHLTGAQGWRR